MRAPRFDPEGPRFQATVLMDEALVADTMLDGFAGYAAEISCRDVEQAQILALALNRYEMGK